MTRGNTSHSMEIRDKEIRRFSSRRGGTGKHVCNTRFLFSFRYSTFIRRDGATEAPSVNRRGSETLEWNECPVAYKISNLAFRRPNLTRKHVRPPLLQRPQHRCALQKTSQYPMNCLAKGTTKLRQREVRFW